MFPRAPSRGRLKRANAKSIPISKTFLMIFSMAADFIVFRLFVSISLRLYELESSHLFNLIICFKVL